MHFCRICRTEKNLKYTVKELRKFSRKRCNDRLLCTTPTLGNICHECEDRLHNFHRLDEHEDNEERIIVDDDELLYNLFFEKMEHQRLMKHLIVTGGGSCGVVDVNGGGGGGEWCTTTLSEQALVAASASVNVNNGVDEIIEVLTSRENTPSPSLALEVTPVLNKYPATITPTNIYDKDATTTNTDKTNYLNITATNSTTSITNTAAINDNVTPVADKTKISPYKVVAVIDLDDDEDTPTNKPPPTTNSLTPPQTTPDSDEEEIIFRKVEPEDVKVVNKGKRNKKSTRKVKYQNRQINLIASLSLVSSDNDSDVDVTNKEKSFTEPINTPNTIGDTNIITLQQLSTPQKCSHSPVKTPSPSTTSSPGGEIVKVENECTHFVTNPKCPVCQTEFVGAQRLIQHMRRKHRSYDGDELTERPRCAQDSAMTIRLRYMRLFNYYECQLCGCIDAVFKLHKEHVMQKHPEESKSLDDPMMQILKCPVCTEKCGNQHAELLRHMLQTHKIAQCRAYFRQVSHIRNLFTNCSVKKEKDLKRTTRIYQITKRKQYFFECIQCRKIITGYFNYLKHQNSHNSKNISPIKTIDGCNSRATKNDTPKTPTSTSPKSHKPITRRTSSKRNSLETKTEQLSKAKEKKDSSNQKKKQPSLPQQQTVTSAAQKSVQQLKEQSRRQRKLSKKAVQAALVKVKVKPPLKQLPTQRYNCNICNITFKGFRRMNLHLIRLHEFNNADDILRCSVCMLRFLNQTHLKQHEQTRHICKQKRKSNVEKTKNINGCNNSSEQHKKCHVRKNGFAVCVKLQKTKQVDTSLNLDMNVIQNDSWLQELLTLASNKQNKINSKTNRNDTNSDLLQKHDSYENGDDEKVNKMQNITSIKLPTEQCLYCSHLFCTLPELHSHEQMHIQHGEAKQLKRIASDILFVNKSTSR